MTRIIRPGISEDAFLGGRVMALQPERGYRSGIDSVLLAAAAPVEADRPASACDLGSGAGVVGLCLAARLPLVDVTLIELDGDLVALAAENIARNGVAGRARVICADATASGPGHEALGLDAGSFDHILINPPYFAEGQGRRAEIEQRARSRSMAEGDLDRWLRTAARLARSGGTLTMIHRVAALKEVLDAIAGRFGGASLLPLQARPGEPATRLMVRAVKGSRAPLSLLAPFALHEADGSYRQELMGVLQYGAALVWP